MDTDDSGSIEFREFIAAVVNWQQLRVNDIRKLHKCALEMFESIDMDGNGYVDPEDLKLVSSTLQSMPFLSLLNHLVGPFTFPVLYRSLQKCEMCLNPCQ